jgi:outer membrane cobalamin receptor
MLRKGSFIELSLIAATLLMPIVKYPAYAQDSVDVIGDPIVVSVSEKPLPVSAVSATVTVIGRGEIETSPARNVGELLMNTPGLHVSRTGGAGGRASISIRGGDPNFTLVLIDGVAVNDITDILGGSFDFSTLSTVNIEAINFLFEGRPRSSALTSKTPQKSCAIGRDSGHPGDWTGNRRCDGVYGPRYAG